MIHLREGKACSVKETWHQNGTRMNGGSVLLYHCQPNSPIACRGNMAPYNKYLYINTVYFFAPASEGGLTNTVFFVEECKGLLSAI